MNPDVAVPLLPDLEPVELPDDRETDRLELADARVERAGGEPIATARVHIQESEVHGLALELGAARELFLRDSVLVECDLSNATARGAEIRRVELRNPRLVGLGITEGEIDDLRISGGTLMLGSIAGSKVRHAIFENVNLREASFADSRLESVAFEGCDLAGADFRGAELQDCAIRGSSLEGVSGIESLRGVKVPWNDLIASTGALAETLGIVVEREEAQGSA